jgi:hypothetical protein
MVLPEYLSHPNSTGVCTKKTLVATEITEFDILLGRGKASFNHDGNRRFRKFIANHASTYANLDDCFDKSMVVYAVYQSIICAGGRFLQYKNSLNGWCEVEAKVARSKIGHAIRDAITFRQDHPGYHDGNVPTKITVCFRQVSPTDGEDPIRNWEETQPSSVPFKLVPQPQLTAADYAVFTPIPTALNYFKVNTEDLVAPAKFQEVQTPLDTVELKDFDSDVKEGASDDVLSVPLQDLLNPCDSSINEEIDSYFLLNMPSSCLVHYVVDNDDDDDSIFLREIDACLDSNSSEDFKALNRSWHSTICRGKS